MTTPVNSTKSRPRLGCVYRPQNAPERLATTASAADQAGLDELWVWEDCFLSGGISAAAIALSHSSNLTVGIGVLPAPMRNVAVTAMEIATLARSFPGRVRVGVGHGMQDWMAQIGAKVESPMTLLREYLTCLTRLLHGDEVSFHGRYVELDAVTLAWPPMQRIEVLSGAMGPKSLQLSGELAAGTVITGDRTAHGLRSAIEQIRIGKSEGDAASRAHSIVVYVPCTTGADAKRELIKEKNAWGYDPESDVGVYGGSAAVATGVRRWIDAGADTIVLQPTASADAEQFVQFVGAEVRPLLH